MRNVSARLFLRINQIICFKINRLFVTQFFTGIFLVAFFAQSATAKEIANSPTAPVVLAPEDPEKFNRPIGFNLNLASLLSLTYEGRFNLGLSPRFSFVASPSFQYIPWIPWYHPKRAQWSVFNIQRMNLGLGIKTHFYDYDSKDGFYLEALGRPGLIMIGLEKYFSLIPSLIAGYTAIYDSGYTVSFGAGVEWEFIFGKKGRYYGDFYRSAYYSMTKIPITGELSIGWTW